MPRLTRERALPGTTSFIPFTKGMGCMYSSVPNLLYGRSVYLTFEPPADREGTTGNSP